MINKNRKKIGKKFGASFLSGLIILSSISMVIIVAKPVSACNYTVGTFESDYTTTKVSFYKGETVYGNGTADVNRRIKLRIRDPENNIVYYSNESKKIVHGSYVLDDTAQTGVWNIQLGVYCCGWTWSTKSGRIAYFTVNDANFTLTVNVNGNGSVIKDPDKTNYSYGTVVNLTAVPDLGWSFSNWSGDLESDDNPECIVMDSNKSVTAHFVQNQYVLNIDIVGNGSVVKDLDQSYYTYGAIVNLTAVADSGWYFDHWNGDLSGNDTSASITIDDNKNVTAVFIEYLYTLTVNVDPPGNGVVDIDPSGPYHHGDIVNLTAIPFAGSTFDHWSGDLCGNSNPKSIIMNGSKNITAHFIQDKYTLTIDIEGSGSVNKIPDQLNYTYGTLVELTAVPDSGWTFSHWSGDLSGSTNPKNITMDDNKTVTAHFTQDKYNLTVNTVGNGTVTIEPDQNNYTYGNIINLTAVADPGWTFSHWSGDLNSTNSSVSIFINSSKNVTACFTQDNYTLTITIVGSGSVSKYPDNSSYLYGTNVELTASPSSGWLFDDWSGDLVGNSNPAIINMTNNKIVIAHFIEKSGGGSSSSRGGTSKNKPPVADLSAGELYIGFIDEEIEFNGTLSYDPDGQIVEWYWDFGDGTTAIGEITTHAYSNHGEYIVILKVRDNMGADDIDETTAIISRANRPPSDLNVSGPTEGLVNIKYNFSIVSNDEDNDKINYIIDWGDETTNESDFLPAGTKFNITHKWMEAGNYTIKVIADDNETIATAEFTIKIDEPEEPVVPEVNNIVLILLAILALLLLILFLIPAKRRKDKEEEENKESK